MSPKTVYPNSDTVNDLSLLFPSNLKYKHRFLTNLAVVVGYE